MVPVLISTLGVTTSGVWFAFQGFLAFAQLSDFGFGFAISRQVAFTLASRTRMARHDLLEFEPGWAGVIAIADMSLKIYAGICTLAIGALIVIFELIIPHTEMHSAAAPYRIAWYLAGSAGIATLAAGWQGALLIGMGKTHWVRCLSGTCALAQGTFVVIAATLGGSLTSMSAVTFFTALLFLVAMHFLYRRSSVVKKSPLQKQSISRLAEFIRIAAPVGTVNVASFFFSSIQIPLLASLLGPEKIAPFYLAQKIGQFLNRVAIQSIQPQLPFFTNMLAAKHNKQARYCMIKSLIASSALLCGTSLIFLTTPLLTTAFHFEQNYPGIPTITLMTFDYFLLGCTSSIAQFVLAAGRNPFIYSTLAAGLLNVALIFLLVPQIGLVALPFSTIISGLLTNYWLAPATGLALLNSLNSQSR